MQKFLLPEVFKEQILQVIISLVEYISPSPPPKGKVKVISPSTDYSVSLPFFIPSSLCSVHIAYTDSVLNYFLLECKGVYMFVCL